MRMTGLVVLLLLAAGHAVADVPGPAWTASVPVPGFSSAGATAVTVDAAGNILAAGSAGDFPDADVVVASLDRLGTVRWVRVHDGPDHGVDRATSISTDATGNAYVTADENAAGAKRAVLLKYGTDGSLLWERRYANGTAGAGITKPALDAGGNLYFVVVAGGVQTLVSLDPAGSERFARLLAPGFGYTSTAIAPDGTLVAAAGIVVTHFVRFDLAGNELTRGTGVQWAEGQGSALAFGPDGEVFVATGEVLTKFDAAGLEAWHYRFTGRTSPATCVCTTWALAADAAGRATLVGESFRSFRLTLEVIRFDRSGAVLWNDSYSPAVGGGGGAGGGDIVLGDAGTVDVVGWGATPGGPQWFVARYAADGSRTDFGGAAIIGQPVDAARIAADGLVVAGYATRAAGQVFTVVRYGVDAPPPPPPPPSPAVESLPVPIMSGWAALLLAWLVAAAGLQAAARRRRS